MGALLGMISGGVLGYAGQKHREKLQSEQHAKDFVNQAMMEHLQKKPMDWLNPEVQKSFKKQFGEETFNSLKPTFDVTAASAQRDAAQLHSMLTGQPPQQGPAQPSAPTPTAGGAPQMASGPGGPPPPMPQPSSQGQGQPAGGPATPPASPTGPAPAPTDYHAAFQAIQDKERQLIEANLPDEQMKTVTHWLDGQRKDLVAQMKGSGKGEITPLQAMNFAQRQQFHADAMMVHQQDHADTMSLREQAQSATNEFRSFAMQMSAQKEKDAQQQHYAQLVNGLQSRIGALAKMPPDQAKPLLAGINGNMQLLKRQAQKAGIEFDPEMFKPLKVESVPNWHSRWGIGSDTSTLTTGEDAAAPASAGKDGATPQPNELQFNKKTGQYRQWQGDKWVMLDGAGK